MSIFMMCEASDQGAVRSTYWSQQTGRDIFLKETHEGTVLSLREANYHDDSDFYALVWDHGAREPKEIMYATTRGWTYPNGAVVDATPEVRALYDAFNTERMKEEEARHTKRMAATPAKGKNVRVVKGWKIPIGTVGTLFWVGKDRFERYLTPWQKELCGSYGDPRDGLRVGIEVEGTGERFFTRAMNVEVIV